ncbi:MAG TPA: hypothetical protein VMU02_10290 [bacterium]|nr:hypothetical protein [bacterium]
MPPRRQAGGKGGGRRVSVKLVAKILGAVAGIVIAVLVANYVYFYRADLKHFFSTAKAPDAAAIDKAIADAYTRIAPLKVSTTSLAAGTHQIKQDRVVIAKKGSLLRANYEITHAIEGVGGRIASGVESTDDKGHGASVTLAVSDGQMVVREIRLERSKK